jgi:hypothetical protein
MSFPQIGVDSIYSGGWSQLSIDLGDNGLFLEYAAKIAISRFLEQECQRQEEFWAQRMAELRTLMPVGHLPTPQITRVDPKNVYTGARPSLLQAPIEFWPNITIRAGALRPSRVQPDNYSTFDCDLYVEVMTLAGPIDKEHLHLQEGIDCEGDVNLQTHLLSNAVYMAIVQDPTFGGAIEPIQNPPAITPSFPAAVAGTDQERVGDYWLYQGRQLRYTVTRSSF